MSGGAHPAASAAALEFVADLARTFGPRVHELLARRARCRRGSTPASAPTSCRDARRPRGRLDGGAAARGPARPARRDHRARSTAR